MTRTQLNNDTDTLLDDSKPEGSIAPSQDAALRKKGYDYSEQVVADNVQNNLLPSATMSPSVDAVNAGLESYAEDVQAQIDQAIAGVYRDAGNYDASVGTFPTQTEQGNPVQAGDLFTVEVAGTLGGVTYSKGEAFRALVDNPGQTASNWRQRIFTSEQQTITTPGIVRKATDAEVVAGTANDNSVSTKQLQDKLDNLPSASQNLQSVTDNGDTITGFDSTTTVNDGRVRVVSNTDGQGVNIFTLAIQWLKSGFSLNVQHPDTLTANRNIKWPDESGTVALKKYKSYVALISQSGTSAPTVTVIHNDIGNIVFSRDTVGTYRATLTGAFPANKTFIPNAKYAISGEEAIHLGVAYYRVDNNYIGFNSYFNANEEDGILQGESLEIRVYN